MPEGWDFLGVLSMSAEREQEISLGEVAAAGGGAQRLTGVPMTRDKLVELLRHTADLVEAGESLEGMINWLAPELSDSYDTYARVEARYRTGDHLGQGGYELVGQWVDEKKHVVRHMGPGKSSGSVEKKEKS